MKHIIFYILTINMIVLANTAIDGQTKLVWQDDSDTVKLKLTHDKSLKYCNNLNLNGKNNWSLPTINQLHTIVSVNTKVPTKDIIKNVSDTQYWSKTPFANGKQYVWGINFKYGSAIYYERKHKFNVRCVREE